MHIHILSRLILVTILAIAAPAWADIYKYRGPDGRLIISNTPPPANAQVDTRLGEGEHVPTAKGFTRARPVPRQSTGDRDTRGQRKRQHASSSGVQTRGWKQRYEAGHRHFSHLTSFDVQDQIRRYRRRLLARDAEHRLDSGSRAIHTCDKKYWNPRSKLACLYAHYGG